MFSLFKYQRKLWHRSYSVLESIFVRFGHPVSFTKFYGIFNMLIGISEKSFRFSSELESISSGWVCHAIQIPLRSISLCPATHPYLHVTPAG